MNTFYVGLHQPSDARDLAEAGVPCMVSVNRLLARQSGFDVDDWMLDCAGFSEVALRGGYREGPEVYAARVVRWSAMPPLARRPATACPPRPVRRPRLVAAVSQDWMCEPFVLAKTGLSVGEHQRRTIERYVAIRDAVAAAGCATYILPVLQGYAPREYVQHIRDYGALLPHGAWVGVGSVCKRNASPAAIERVLLAIHAERPDLRLHGFGVKLSALLSPFVWDLLHTADSMAWSYAARRNGRSANDWREAATFAARVHRLAPSQGTIFSLMAS